MVFLSFSFFFFKKSFYGEPVVNLLFLMME